MDKKFKGNNIEEEIFLHTQFQKHWVKKKEMTRGNRIFGQDFLLCLNLLEILKEF